MRPLGAGPRWPLALILLALVSGGGCAGGAVRSQSPEASETTDATRLVGDLAAPAGMYPVKVESIGLITNLPGTGSDPPPSFERAAILSEMQTRGVQSPNKLLATGAASVVVTVGYLRAGIEKGDRFDVEVRVPSRSETASLRGGWLMESRMKEIASVNQQLREGTLWALATGPILLDPNAADGTVEAGRGRVLGGGVALRTRNLGLVLKNDHRSVPKASLVGKAVNQRFHTFVAGSKQGVAKPLSDEYIELLIHPRYKHNVARYMQVVRAIPLRQTATERLERLSELERQLLDPVTADTAALRLEAIGREAIGVLKKGLAADDPLVRFHAGEALAYLDEASATEVLRQAAAEEPAFRLYALTALSTITDFTAFEALQSLLASPSAETRYGAFRALWAMNPADPLVKGRAMGDQFTFHPLAVAGPPMIHLTHSVRPEIVSFGGPHRFVLPLVLEAGHELLLKSTDDGQLTITRLAVGHEQERRTVAPELGEVVAAMAELGATYPDVVHALQQAVEKKYLPVRLEVDAVPEPGRLYAIRPPGRNENEAESADETANGTGLALTNPVPDLFPKRDRRPLRPAPPLETAKAPADAPVEGHDAPWSTEPAVNPPEGEESAVSEASGTAPAARPKASRSRDRLWSKIRG